MRKLYHFPIDPASRQARIALAEKKLKVKLGCQNIINAPFKLMEDSNRDNKINSKNDNTISSLRRGALFSLGLSYNL